LYTHWNTIQALFVIFSDMQTAQARTNYSSNQAGVVPSPPRLPPFPAVPVHATQSQNPKASQAGFDRPAKISGSGKDGRLRKVGGSGNSEELAHRHGRNTVGAAIKPGVGGIDAPLRTSWRRIDETRRWRDWMAATERSLKKGHAEQKAWPPSSLFSSLLFSSISI